MGRRVALMPNGEIEIDWVNGRDKFNIARLEYVLNLEAKTGWGFAEILKRLEDGTWNYQSVRETIRLGLMGGGKTEIEAQSITIRWVDQGGRLGHCAQVAHTVIRAMMVGVEGDNDFAQKKTDPLDPEKSNDQSIETTDGSGGPSSTGGEPRSDSLPARSIN